MIESNLKNAKILIIDDHQPNIDLLVGFLQMQRFKILKVLRIP